MRLVLDASVTLCWLYSDEQDALADAALALLLDDSEAFVPSIWWYEVRNSAHLGLRKTRISESDSNLFFARLNRLPIIIAPIFHDQAIFALARKHSLTFYDACYLELAQRESIPLATLDNALAKASTAEGLALIGAASSP